MISEGHAYRLAAEERISKRQAFEIIRDPLIRAELFKDEKEAQSIGLTIKGDA